MDVNTIDMSKVYLKSRYDKGEAAYLNVWWPSKSLWISMKPWSMRKKLPLILWKEKYFEGCMPIEVMAKRGIKTMLYGPMKPVGLEYPEDYKGLVMVTLKHRMQLFSFVRIMRLEVL